MKKLLKSLVLMALILSMIMAGTSRSMALPGTPLLYIDPSVSLADVGEYFTIDIKVADVTGMLGWEVYLDWSKALVTINSTTVGAWTYYNITEGPFLKGPFYHEPPSSPAVSTNTTDSSVEFVTDPKNAYDGDESTYGYMGYGQADRSGEDPWPTDLSIHQWNISAFSIGDRKSGDIIDQVDLKIKYGADGSGGNDQYRILYWVPPSTTETVLQDWTNAENATNTWTWTNISEPNTAGGIWTWEYVSGLVVGFEGAATRDWDGNNLYVYEVWLSIKYHHTTLMVSNTENVESEGWVMFGTTMLGDVTLLSGSGTLASVIFKVLAGGECDLHLYETLILDSAAENIPHATQDGKYKSRLVGDINRDGIVNIYDLATIGVAYGKSYGEEGYNPEADLNGDLEINIVDLAMCAQNYGKYA